MIPLLTLLLVAPARLPDPAPPAVEVVLYTDSLVVDSLFFGEGRSAWPFRFARTAPVGEAWMELHDPFGGSFFGPVTMVAAPGEEATAFAEDGRPGASSPSPAPSPSPPSLFRSYSPMALD